MNEQVLTTITSASSSWETRVAPACASMPIMTSLSTRFLGHPRLTKPTLAGAVGSEIADMLFFTGTGTVLIMISGKQLYTILASNIAISVPAAAGRRNPSTKGDIVSFPPIRVGRATLMEQKIHPSRLRRRDVG